jgi:hypothetical protein
VLLVDNGLSIERRPWNVLVHVSRAARIVGKSIGVLGACALVLLVAWLGVNLFDEDLTPTAAAMLAATPNTVRSEDNIYVAMAGFDAPSHTSMVEVGASRIETYNRALDKLLADVGAGVAYLNKPEPPKLKFIGDVTPWKLRTSSIWNTVKNRRADVLTLVSTNRELYQRYLDLHKLPSYVETARPSYLSPTAYVDTAVRATFLANAAVRLQSGTLADESAALRDLAEDLYMWKAVLGGQGPILSKVIAASAVHSDSLLLGDYVVDPSSDLSFLDGEARSAILPFNTSEWHMGNAYISEFRAQAALVSSLSIAQSHDDRSSKELSSWFESALQRRFFKQNATENLEAALMGRLRGLADGDPAQFSAGLGDFHRWVSRNVWSDSVVPPLYNPVGRALVGIAVPPYEDYPKRVYDVAAMQRLVFLAYQIRRQSISAADIPGFMKQHPEWSTHPIDGTPLRWDLRTHVLSVVRVGRDNDDRRFSLTLKSIAE